MFFFIMIAGVIAWLYGLGSIALDGVTIRALFFVVIGGQLTRLGYAPYYIDNLDKKLDAILDAARNASNRR